MPATIQKADIILNRIESRLKTAKNASVKVRLLKCRDRVLKVRAFMAQSTITDVCLLQEKAYKPWRELTEVEKKTDFRFLNESFNDLEAQLEQALTGALDEDAQRNVKRIEGKLKAGDIAAIAAMSFIGFQKIYAIISEYLKKSFEVGKKTGAQELDVERPLTPTKSTQIMNFEAAQIAEDFVNEVNSEAKEKAKHGLANGIATVAVVGAVNNVVRDKAKKFINDITGGIISKGVNDGRKAVFEKNVSMLQGYQRSELLDDRTCNICLSLDSRIVTADDPMAKLNQVHTNCRGIWVPILNADKAEGVWGIPKTVQNQFDTVGGVPAMNSFKQMKSVVNKANPAVQKIVKRKK